MLLVLLLAIGHAAGPYLFRVATLQSEIATQVRVTTGLTLATPGRARFDLLPSPRIKMAAVHVSDPSGTLTIDAEAVEGEVRLLPLLVGRLELASATLTKPRLVIDLDGRPVPPDSLIGRAIHAHTGAVAGGDQRLGAVTLVDGTATLVSRTPRHLPQFSDIDMTVDWRDLDSPATLTGTMRVAGTATDVAAWIEQPSALMRGDRSAATLRLRSAPLDLTASGDVTAAATTSFKGQLTASAPSLPGLVALCGKARRAARAFRGPDLEQRGHHYGRSCRRGHAQPAEPPPHRRRQHLRGHARLPGRRHAAAVGHAGHRPARAAAFPRPAAAASRAPLAPGPTPR